METDRQARYSNETAGRHYRASSRNGKEGSILAETNKNLSQLVEINRALAQDLDVSRRMVAELSRERDKLEEQVELLEENAHDLSCSKIPNERVIAKNRVRCELKEKQRETEEMRKEIDLVTRDAAAAKSRAEQAERRFAALRLEFESIVRERDYAMAQLDESTAAMKEIRYRLASNMDGAGSIFAHMT